MKIVYSFIDFKDNKRFFSNNLIINISLKLIKKHGYETILYVDEQNYHNLKKFNFDDIKIINKSELEKLPNIWSIGKLLTFSKINEPFCHIDFDVFLFRNNLKKFEKEKFFCFHEEHWRSINEFKELADKANNDLESFRLIKNKKTYNCALLGGIETQEINKTAEIVLKNCMDHKKFYDDINQKFMLQNPNNSWITAVFIEQILFMNLCKERLQLKDIPIILDFNKYTHLNKKKLFEAIGKEMEKEKIIHLWGGKKNFINKLKNFK